MSELTPRVHAETNGLDYVLVGDCYIPVIEFLGDDDRPIGKWGGCTGLIGKKRIHFYSAT